MIDLNNVFAAIKSIICLNGEIPDNDFFTRYAHLPLIAADGAGSTLVQSGIMPNLIVGDLDSLDRSIIPGNIEVLHVAEQLSTDFDKTLNAVKVRNLFPCLVYGATGKETDHTLYNLQVMANYAPQHRIIFHDSAFKDKDKYGLFVADKLIGNLKPGANISFFAFCPTVISTVGLKWELDQIDLSPTVSNTRNSIKTSEFAITVHKGSVLVLFDA